MGQAREEPVQRWRVEDIDGKQAPFATVIRYFTDNGLDGEEHRTGEVLVIARVGTPGGIDACHVAMVDVLANPDEAMVLAERAADEQARGFDCDSGKVEFSGKSGVSPALMGDGPIE